MNSKLNLGHTCVVVSLLDIHWPNAHYVPIWLYPFLNDMSTAILNMNVYMPVCCLIAYKMLFDKVSIAKSL